MTFRICHKGSTKSYLIYYFAEPAAIRLFWIFGYSMPEQGQLQRFESYKIYLRNSHKYFKHRFFAKGGVGGPTTQIQHHSMLVQTSFDSSIPGGGFGPHITGKSCSLLSAFTLVHAVWFDWDSLFWTISKFEGLLVSLFAQIWTISNISC